MALAAAGTGSAPATTVAFYPGRILIQDASGIPVLADLVTLQEAVSEKSGDPAAVMARLRLDLVVDHSVEVDFWGEKDSADRNLARELDRHAERFRFLRWAQTKLPTLRVVPPGIGICHQLNLEVLADVVHLAERDGHKMAGFDSVLGYRS